ncbi:hypothetical protein EI94DRAFT_1759461, partial [Lactarius quietus]
TLRVSCFVLLDTPASLAFFGCLVSIVLSFDPGHPRNANATDRAFPEVILELYYRVGQGVGLPSHRAFSSDRKTFPFLITSTVLQSTLPTSLSLLISWLICPVGSLSGSKTPLVLTQMVEPVVLTYIEEEFCYRPSSLSMSLASA